MRLTPALAILLLVVPATAQTWKLKAVDSVSISRNTPFVFNDNRIRAYNNPTASYRDIHGVYKFDVTAIPDTANIVSMRLTLHMENAFGSPRNGPVVNLHHSKDDGWTRASATPSSAPLGTIVTAKQANFVHPKHVFQIDLNAHDFTTDLRDDRLTLAIDNINLNYSYVYFFGHIGAPSGPNAELEIVACAGSATAFGSGGKDCSATEHRLGVTGCPARGQSVVVEATVGAFIQLPILLFAGRSDTRWAGLALPYDLARHGAPGNSIYVSLDFFLGAIPNPGGGGRVELAIPDDPSLRNATLFFQSILFNCGANPLRLVFSNGVRMTIG